MADAPSPHGLDSAHHTGTISDTQAPQFLKTDGSRQLAANLAVASGVTIDGVDISVLKSNYDSHIGNPLSHNYIRNILDDASAVVGRITGTNDIRIYGADGISVASTATGLRISGAGVTGGGGGSFIGIRDNASVAVVPTGGYLSFSDDGIINVDASGANTLAFTVNQAGILHSAIGGKGADDHHAAFVGIKTGASSVDPDANDQITFDSDHVALVISAAPGTITFGLHPDNINLDTLGSNLSWNRVSKVGSSIADLATRSHTSLTDIGTNTHAQIDTHLASTSNPHGVTPAQLGLVIGSDVQAWDADLDILAGLAKTNGNFIVGNGTTWVVKSGSTARASLGLGSMATQNANSVSISGGSATSMTSVNSESLSGGSLLVSGVTTLQSVNIYDTVNLEASLSSPFGSITTGGYMSAGSGLGVTGNITVTGTVDGVDIASLSSAYNSHAANTSNPHSVTKAQVGLSLVENTALSTWAGTSNITTLGTVATGTWQGTPIANGYVAGLNQDLLTTSDASFYRLRLATTSDVGLSSTLHPFQIGSSTSTNIAIDDNEIMARNNGSTSTLYINNEGGTVHLGGALSVASSATATDYRSSGTWYATTGTGNAFIFRDGGGSEHMRILNTGNIGIGTTNPGVELDVAGDVDISGDLTVDTDTLFVDSATGHVGIGTAVPFYPLHVKTNHATEPVVSIQNTNASAVSNGIVFLDELDNYAFQFGFNNSTDEAYFWTNYAYDFKIGTNGAECFRVDGSTGNVGIGTATPGGALDIKPAGTGNVQSIRLSNISNVGDGIYGYSATPTHIWSLVRSDAIGSGSLSLSAYGGIGLSGGATSGPEVSNADLFVSSGGNVGIGTLSPGALLDVSGSGHFSGDLEVDSDLDVGAGLLFVDYSNENVGINTYTPDPQFALDVAGPIRGTVLVGPHAIQLPNAKAIFHFDGPDGNDNYTGDSRSHMGLRPTTETAVIYRPGKFGKAVQVAEATTNLCPNPSFENDTSTWHVYDNDVMERVTYDSFHGGACVKLYDSAGSSAYIYDTQSAGTIGATTGDKFTFSAWVKGVGAMVGTYCYVNIRENGDGATQVSSNVILDGTWQRISVTRTLTKTTVSSVDVWVQSAVGTSTSDYLLIDSCQLEEKAYATPYCDGSLGDGHAWTGTAHASQSSRSRADLRYDKSLINKSPDTGTVMAWAKHDSRVSVGWNNWLFSTSDTTSAFDRNLGLIFQRSTESVHSVTLMVNGVYSGSIGAANITHGEWHHYAVTWDGTNTNVYVDGVLYGTVSDSLSDPVVNDIRIGNLAGGDAYICNGLIDDFAILSEALDADTIRAIYESNAPVFAESSVHSFRAGRGTSIWADESGFWAKAEDGTDLFAIAAVDGESWGGTTLDAGDVMMGTGSSYAKWDKSTSTFSFVGNGSGLTAINGSNITTGTISANRVDLTGYLTAAQVQADYVTATNIAATYATISTLTADYLTAANIAATYATISTLTADYLTASNISATYATIATLTADYLTASNISATYATISTLTADYLTAANISATYATISTLTTDYLTSAQIDTQYLKVGEAEGDITTISGSKITTGTINASLVNVTNINASNISTGTLSASRIAANSIDASKLISGSITTNEMDVLALELINNFSRTKDGVSGWSSNFTMVTDPATVITGTGNIGKFTSSANGVTVSEYFRVDPTASYKVTLSVYYPTPSPTGRIYFGMYAYDESGTLLSVDTYNVSTRTYGSANSNPYFWYTVAAGDAISSWRHMTAYMLAADTPAEEAPVGSNVDRLYRFPHNTAKARIRVLNYNNGGTSSDLYVYSPSVTKIGTGQIHADSIVANSITAAQIATGTITAGLIDVDDLFAQNISVTGTFTLGTGGEFVADAATIDGSGIWIDTGTADGNKVRWEDGGTVYGEIYGDKGVGTSEIAVRAKGAGATANDSTVTLEAYGYSSGYKSVYLGIEAGSTNQMTFSVLGSPYVTLDSNGLDVNGIALTDTLQVKTVTSTPSAPGNGSAANIYVKGDKIVIQYQDGETTRYRYMNLNGFSTTWTHTTTAP